MVEQFPSEETPLLSSAAHWDPEATASRSSSAAAPRAAQDDGWKPTWNLRLIQSGEQCLGTAIDDGSSFAKSHLPAPAQLLNASVTWCNVFLAGFDSTVAASTYSIIGSEFGSANNAVWVSTSYLITATAFQPLYGRLSDMFGRRKAFLLATSTFAIGCLLCGLAQSMLVLNLSRALTGVGGGGLMTMATIVLSDGVPFHRRGLYQSANNLMYGLGSAAGASVGGIVAHAFGWRSAFLLQVPMAIAAVIGGWALVGDPAVRSLPPDAPVDVAGSVTLVGAITLLLLGLSMGGNELDWTSPITIALFIAALLLFGLFYRVETRAVAPILPSRMLKGTLAVSNIITNFTSGMAVYGYLFMAPMYFLGVLLEPINVVGLRLIVPSLGFPIGAVIAGVVMSKYGHLSVLVRSGCAVLIVGLVIPWILFGETKPRTGVVYLFALLPANIGQGLINPSSLFTMLAAYPHDDQAVATSTVYLCRSIGNVAGVALSAAILQNWLRTWLPEVLKDTQDADQIMDAVRHSIVVIRDLPPATRDKVTETLSGGIQAAISACIVLSVLALISSFWARGVGMQRSS